MSKLSINDIDLGDVETPKIPYEKRNHVAFLIGSGFSVPCGMPTGRQLNDYILNIEKAPITFDYSGKLAVSSDGGTGTSSPRLYRKHGFFLNTNLTKSIYV